MRLAAVKTLAAMRGKRKTQFAVLEKHPKGVDDVPATVLWPENHDGRFGEALGVE